jgi:succinoglycan biosynthesis transport protein ExoP
MGDYISVIRRRKLLIAAMTLAGLALALFYSVAVAKPSYVSSAKVLVRPITSDVTPQNVDRLIVMGSEREIATSTDVSTIAKERMKSTAPVTALQKKVTVNVVGTTQFLNVSCSDKTKLGAQTCAQAFADAYLQWKTQEATKNRDGKIANANAALAPINAQINDAGTVVSMANRPGTPASPRPKTNAVLGSFFGLFLGLLVAFGRDRVDNRLRGRVDLEEYLRAPVLATVPRTRRNGRTAPTLVTMQHPNSPASEAYRALRTRMLVMAERQGLKTIMVASPTGEDGKTAIAANLAVSLAQVGKRVVLLSADLRGSKVHQYFGLDNERGLSNVLAGEMPPWEAVQEPAGLERLWVFGSGPVPAQPAELLQSDLMRELLAERRKVADFVIIEAPAALNASDCLALAPLVDGILVVADAKHTDRDEIEQVRIQFEQVGGQVVGSVMSNAVTARR